MTKITFNSIRKNSKETPENPPQSKVTVTLPSSNSYQQDDTVTPVNIYIHNPSSKSIKITVSPQLSVQEIKQIIEDKSQVKKDHQVLHLNGKNVTEYGNIRLQANNIIHVLDFDNKCKREEKIMVKLTLVNFVTQKKDKIVKKYEIEADSLVGDFIDHIEQKIKQTLEIESKRTKLYLMESSRVLQREKSFLDQDIPKNAQIACVITENEIKTRFSNDTKQEIMQDISDILGFEPQQKKTEVKQQQQKTIRPRYLPPIQNNKIKGRPTGIRTQRSYEDQDPYGLRASLTHNASTPNFKKKQSALSKAHSFDELPRTPLTKLKASKSKKDIESLLKSQGKELWIFESPDTIKETGREQRQEDEEREIERPRSSPQAPSIPKVMPIVERRKIKMEFDLLFGDSDNKSSPAAPETPEQSDTKEQIKPISPPTESKPDNKLRLSMGSRPVFLDQLRLPINQKTQKEQ